MEPNECPVVWPTDPTAGDLMPDYIRPQHTCTLPAGHVHEQQQPTGGYPAPVPHRCHCGAWLPVRDVEPAAGK